MHDNAKRKAKLERMYLESFRESWDAFPVGEIASANPPDPDFIVHREGGAVGIELTRLFHPNDRYRPAQEGLQAQILRAAEAHYDTISPGAPARFVNVRFTQDFEYTKASARNVGAALAKRVLHHTEPLPPGVDSVAIYPSSATKSRWLKPASGLVWHLTAEQLQERIDAKRGRCEGYYRRCAEVWLLLVATGNTPSEFIALTDEARAHTFKSGFDRLFYFDIAKSDVAELRNERIDAAFRGNT